MTKPSTGDTHILIDSVERLIPEIPADSIVSRAVFSAGDTKVILFGFAAGQELSEHTAPRPAMLHFLRGTASLTLGDETMEAGPGTLVHMTPDLPHSIHAESDLLMLLTMLPRPDDAQS